MDPQETLWNLLDSIRRNDRSAVDECLLALSDWNCKGGFMPTVDRPDSQSVSHLVVRRVVPESETGPDDRIVDAEDHLTPEGILRDCPAERVSVSPGDHVLLPANWRKGDWSGPLVTPHVVQRPSPIDDDVFVVTPVDDDMYETNMHANVLHWGRIAWLQESSGMSSGMHGAEEGCSDEDW